MKLGLGTVQFGMNYGISNTNGQPNKLEIQKILEFAKNNGINIIDTAHLYGISESVLGEFNLEDFDVITKTIKIDYSLSRQENFDRFKDAFYLSQKRLGYIPLYGLMFHQADDLLSEQGLALWDLVEDFKDKEYIYKIGVSVYNPEQLIDIIDRIDIDIVQIPLNLLDQRFVGLLPELKRKGIEIHTRSTFLQGLILMNEYQIPEYFREIKPILKSIPEPRLATALSFPRLIKEVDKIIVGSNRKEELEEFIMMYNTDIEDIDYNKFRVDNEKYINPLKWRNNCQLLQ